MEELTLLNQKKKKKRKKNWGINLTIVLIQNPASSNFRIYQVSELNFNVS